MAYWKYYDGCVKQWEAPGGVVSSTQHCFGLSLNQCEKYIRTSGLRLPYHCNIY